MTVLCVCMHAYMPAILCVCWRGGGSWRGAACECECMHVCVFLCVCAQAHMFVSLVVEEF